MQDLINVVVVNTDHDLVTICRGLAPPITRKAKHGDTLKLLWVLGILVANGVFRHRWAGEKRTTRSYRRVRDKRG